jgi:hypothetical protein
LTNFATASGTLFGNEALSTTLTGGYQTLKGQTVKVFDNKPVLHVSVATMSGRLPGRRLTIAFMGGTGEARM